MKFIKVMTTLTLFSITAIPALSTANECPPETRTSRDANSVEHIFIRDCSIPNLGEAWRDESGMIWGDYAGMIAMNQLGAVKYCNDIGAKLPSKKDFIRLREYMGAKKGTYVGYTPQVLPNLNLGGHDRYFWTSTLAPYISEDAVYFVGDSTGGFIPRGTFSTSSMRSSAYAVRCVF